MISVLKSFNIVNIELFELVIDGKTQHLPMLMS